MFLLANISHTEPDMPVVPLSIESNHSVFTGHFPGRPIVPGVLLLDQTQRIVESKTWLALAGLPAAKFLAPALPGDMLELEYEVAESVVRFEIRCGVRRIAQGRFLIAPGSTT